MEHVLAVVIPVPIEYVPAVQLVQVLMAVMPEPDE